MAQSDINVWPPVLHCCFAPRSSRKNPHGLLFSRSWSLVGDLGGQRGAAVREKWARRRAGSYPQQRAHASGNLGGRKSYCRERRTGFHQRPPCRWRCGSDRRARQHSNLLFCDTPRDQARRRSQRKNRRKPESRDDRRFRPAREPEKARSGPGQGRELALDRRPL